MSVQNGNPADMVLPALRQDLQLLAGVPENDGRPSWLLYDPTRNRYFKLGKRGVDILRHWQPGKTITDMGNLLKSKGIDAGNEELKTLHGFLRGNELTAACNSGDVDRLIMATGAGSKSIAGRLLHNYLFFRIPLFKADRFLEKTYPLVASFFGGWVRALIILLGMVGLYLAGRRWAEFQSTFLYFFDLRGLFIFTMTTIVVKAAHELGHAFTAKRYGCRVPTMGVAFMVLYPMLYTDTTDAWRLTSHRQRMEIALAGVKVELAIGMLALFAWSFFDDGPLRSAAWFLASVSWLSSLAINLSPLMRFDGYYILSDWLGEENLQPRSFNLARRHLRRLFFGIDDPLPEALSRSRLIFFIVYAWAVWIYRFFLFLGIALMVYHLAFKALGFFLFLVEISWFIILPLWREVKVWYQRRNDMRGSVHPFVTVLLLGTVCLFFFVPWQGRVVIPAVWKAARHSQIYSPEPGRLAEIWVTNGQKVKKGQPLFRVVQEEVNEELSILDIDENFLQTLIERHPASVSELKSISVLKIRLNELRTRQKALYAREQMLVMKAPFEGVVEMASIPNPGEWISREQVLLSLTKPGSGRVSGYVPEGELHRITADATGSFIGQEGDQPDIKVTLQAVSRTAVTALEDPILASSCGGAIAVRGDKEELRPEKGLYRVDFAVAAPDVICTRITSGVVRVNCRQDSLFKRMYQSAAAVLIREFSF